MLATLYVCFSNFSYQPCVFEVEVPLCVIYSLTDMKSVMKDIMQQLVDWNKEEEDIVGCLML